MNISMHKVVIFVILFFVGIFIGLMLPVDSSSAPSTLLPILEKSTPTPTPTMALASPSSQKTILNDYHIFQTFNNCGPAALSMLLSYYGINVSQEILGQELRPYQVPRGINDDKNVSMVELAEKATTYGLTATHRPMGNIEKIKLFITFDIPVLTRTWTKVDEDIGHFRVVKGYDDVTREIIQDDSLQNKNLRISYDDFLTMWEKFSYEYLVLIPHGKEEITNSILGEDIDTLHAWQRAVELNQDLLEKNPSNVTAGFNLSVAFFHTNKFTEAVGEFEKVEFQLPFRMLWYQLEPIAAYYELGNDSRLFTISEKIITNQNRAYSELYLLRGNAYKRQGNIDLALQEYQRAILYNKNFTEAQNAIALLQRDQNNN